MLRRAKEDKGKPSLEDGWLDFGSKVTFFRPKSISVTRIGIIIRMLTLQSRKQTHCAHVWQTFRMNFCATRSAIPLTHCTSFDLYYVLMCAA